MGWSVRVIETIGAAEIRRRSKAGVKSDRQLSQHLRELTAGLRPGIKDIHLALFQPLLDNLTFSDVDSRNLPQNCAKDNWRVHDEPFMQLRDELEGIRPSSDDHVGFAD